MRLSIQLDNQSLYEMTRGVNKYARRLQRKLIRRVTRGKSFAVWEMPYGQPEAVNQFVKALREMFAPEILNETILFVNNGNNDSHQSFLATGFPEALMPHIRPILNNIAGVVQNFNLSPELLIAMSVQGIFEMSTKLTPAKVDRAYGQQASPSTS